MSNQNGLTYEVDPKTGFMVDNEAVNPWTPERKLLLLQELKKNLGAAYKSCRNLGMDYYSYQRHMKIDPVFRNAVRLVQHDLCEEVEQVVVQKAIEGKSPMWNIYYLNNNWPEKYGPRLRIHSDKNEGIKDVWGKVAAIDAEVVQSANNAVDNSVIQSLETKSIDNHQ